MDATHVLVSVKKACLVKMDSEEVDSWYDEEKESIFEKFLLASEDKKNRKEAEKKYKKEMKKLKEKYVKLSEKSNKPNLIKKYSAKAQELVKKIKKK